jgi:glucose/arabinose dehydrogenase
MSKWVAGLLIFLFLLLGLFSILMGKKIQEIDVKKETPANASLTAVPSPDQGEPQSSIVAQNLDTPWALAFLPDNSILFTEREGRVRFIDKNGNLQQQPVAVITEVREISEGGLLGIAVHPDFTSNNYVYVYFTYGTTNQNTNNRVVRYKFANNSLTERTVIVDAIPGAPNHDGGRIKFGPDGYLYIATGDSQEPSLSQDRASLAGKILRVTDDGKPAPGNPFNTAIYSYGHRNPQGLTWDEKGQLWSTEHGRSGFPSGLDELNRIAPGKNYGWPTIQGDETKGEMEKPVLHSGSDTWAPSGAAFYPGRGEEGSIFFAGLRGQGLYEATLNGNSVNLKKHFDGQLGRIREVVLGPDGFLYITTSNHDGRGTPKADDDKILRINPERL